MKNILPKILDFIALGIRIIVYIAVVIAILNFLYFCYTVFVYYFPNCIMVLRVTGIIICTFLTIFWAFLRNKE